MLLNHQEMLLLLLKQMLDKVQLEVEQPLEHQLDSEQVLLMLQQDQEQLHSQEDPIQVLL